MRELYEFFPQTLAIDESLTLRNWHFISFLFITLFGCNEKFCCEGSILEPETTLQPRETLIILTTNQS